MWKRILYLFHVSIIVTARANGMSVFPFDIDICTTGKAVTASGVLHGNVNGIPIINSAILSHSVDGDDKVTVISVIKDIPREIGESCNVQLRTVSSRAM